VDIKAVGTEVEIVPFKGKRKCGALGEAVFISGGKPETAKGKELSTEAKPFGIDLPETSIVEAEYWNGKSFNGINCRMEATLLGKVTESLTMKLQTSPLEGLGWTT
jgi:hypothetical protein